jgi:hypothetical protein
MYSQSNRNYWYRRDAESKWSSAIMIPFLLSMAAVQDTRGCGMHVGQLKWSTS